MQLRSLDLVGFRRFRDATVRLDNPVVAIVGRNEAGKTTVLNGLTLMNNDDPVPPEALSGLGTNPAREVLRLRFRLDDDEKALVADATSGHRPSWLRVIKLANGQRRFLVDPPIPRVRIARDALRPILDSVASRALIGRSFAELNAVRPDIDGRGERLSKKTRPVLERLLATAASLPDGTRDEQRAGWASLATAIGATLTEDDRLTTAQAGDLLRPSMPAFLEFSPRLRALASTYDIARWESNEAIKNVLGAVGMAPQEITRAINDSRPGPLSTIFDRFQVAFSELLSSGWSQDKRITVRLERLDKQIGLTVRAGATEFHAAADRSDGLRSYIALRAFLARYKGKVPPVLLVDEAETHLHYDAQSDLINLFEQQEDVAGVIYTTHSVGCLPQDLGRGVRAVVVDEETGESTIDIGWRSGDVGVMPLLERMGATTSLLVPNRPLLIGEGPADSALWPEIFRCAVDVARLPFQTVGRLSEASDSELRRLAVAHPHLVLIFDGDDAGKKKAERCARLGYVPERIVLLDDGYEVEDLLDAGIYAEAATNLMSEWHGTPLVVRPADVPSPGRIDQLEAWCKQNRLRAPSHREMAEAVLRLLDADDGEEPRLLVDPDQIGHVRRLHEQVIAGLGLEDRAIWFAMA